MGSWGGAELRAAGGEGMEDPEDGAGAAVAVVAAEVLLLEQTKEGPACSDSENRK